MKPTEPAMAAVFANVAWRPVIGRISPKQFGPMMRSFPRRASAKTWRSNSSPSSPRSRNPAEGMRDEVGKDSPAYAARRLRCANHGHGGRMEKHVQRAVLVRNYPLYG